MNTPDKNATGTSNAIPVSDIIDMGYKITPDVKKWGFIYSTSQINAVNTVESAQNILTKKVLNTKAQLLKHRQTLNLQQKHLLKKAVTLSSYLTTQLFKMV